MGPIEIAILGCGLVLVLAGLGGALALAVWARRVGRRLGGPWVYLPYAPWLGLGALVTGAGVTGVQLVDLAIQVSKVDAETRDILLAGGVGTAFVPALGFFVVGVGLLGGTAWVCGRAPQHPSPQQRTALPW